MKMFFNEIAVACICIILFHCTDGTPSTYPLYTSYLIGNHLVFLFFFLTVSFLQSVFYLLLQAVAMVTTVIPTTTETTEIVKYVKAV